MAAAPTTRSAVRRSLPLLLLLAALACSSAPLVNPEPISGASTPALTHAAVVRAVVYTGWTVVSQKPGEVVARLDRGAWDIVVGIDYGEQISIHYVSSDNLGYDGSSNPPTIHAGYNKRVDRLMNAIAREVVLAGIAPP